MKKAKKKNYQKAYTRKSLDVYVKERRRRYTRDKGKEIGKEITE